MVSDVNGLCIGASGSLLPASSGHVQSLLDVASLLSEEGEHPTIHIQGAHSDILITHADGYTTGIARARPFTRGVLQQQQQQQADQTPATEPQTEEVLAQ